MLPFADRDDSGLLYIYKTAPMNQAIGYSYVRTTLNSVELCDTNKTYKILKFLRALQYARPRERKKRSKIRLMTWLLLWYSYGLNTLVQPCSKCIFEHLIFRLLLAKEISTREQKKCLVLSMERIFEVELTETSLLGQPGPIFIENQVKSCPFYLKRQTFTFIFFQLEPILI